MQTSASARSAWTPLAHTVFRWLWIASVASNIGTWMQNVGAAWLMTMLSASPLLVALVQTATNLPVFLLGIHAGAMADIFDRRRLLIVTQSWMLGAAALLALLTWGGFTGPATLLLLTFALGLGSAMNGPAWQAIIPELVPRRELPSAIVINSVGFNIARAVGPAIGGLVIAAVSPAAAFLLNAISFVAVVIVLVWWRRETAEAAESSESVASAVLAGIRYVRFSPPMHGVLLRNAAFAVPASCLWSLLPLIAKVELHSRSSGYGALLGCLGSGAILGGLLLSRFRGRFSPDRLVAAGVAVFGIGTITLAWSGRFWLVCLLLFACGAAWTAVMSSFNTAAQTALPAWVRARGLSVYLLVFQGSMALGAGIWGALAERAGLKITFPVAGLALIAGLAFTSRRSLAFLDGDDTEPSSHWPEPNLVAQPRPDDGPVLITVEYEIHPDAAAAFTHAMRAVEIIRRRDGAVRWDLFEDASQPGRYVESFVVGSWGEHVRQHARATVADRAFEERAQGFHQGAVPPKVTHWIAARR